jgi:hypothetical protein
MDEPLLWRGRMAQLVCRLRVNERVRAIRPSELALSRSRRWGCLGSLGARVRLATEEKPLRLQLVYTLPVRYAAGQPVPHG